MNVLLVAVNGRYTHSNLAVRYLQKYCQQKGYQLDIIEFSINEPLTIITREIYRTEPDVVAFSCYIWNSEIVFSVTENLKKANDKIKIILGGPEVTHQAVEIMKRLHFVDYIIQGEGEETLCSLLKLLNKEIESPNNIPGLIYRYKNKVLKNGEPLVIKDLEQIPMPYSDNDFDKLKNKIIYYETSRGCPFDCSYCLSSTIRGVRYFPLERVKKDLLFLIKKRVKQIKFVDRTFNADKQRAKEIFEFLLENNIQTKFHFEITADLLDDEIIDFLKNIPLNTFQFEIGVQSTNLETLNLINRKMDFARLSHNVSKLRSDTKIHLHLDLIAGLPAEDYDRFTRSFDDIYSLSPHVIQLGFLKLLEGTMIRKNSEIYKYEYTSYPPYEILKNDWIPFAEINRLKDVENLIDIYYNSGAFDSSLNYIISNFYLSPFNFYEEIADFFVQEGLNRQNHSRVSLYKYLLDFYTLKNFKHLEIFKEYLKYDLAANNRGYRFPGWASKIEIDNFTNRRYNFLSNNVNLEKYLPEYIGQSAKKILKNIDFEIFSYNVMENKESAEPIVILFDYLNNKTIDINKEL